MEDDKRFADILEQFDSAVVALKKSRKVFEEEVAELEKRKQDAEVSLRYAKISYEEQLGKNTAYLKEFAENKAKKIAELDKDQAEARKLISEAQDMFRKAEVALKSAEQKEAVASATLSNAQKMKDEYQIKVERARTMAQSLV